MRNASFLKSIAIFSILLFLTAAPACVNVKKDNGKHKGWYKNPHNPHHPASNNPGKAKIKVKSNGGGTKVKVKKGK